MQKSPFFNRLGKGRNVKHTRCQKWRKRAFKGKARAYSWRNKPTKGTKSPIIGKKRWKF